jgi:hygromycin-B 4-O-kinase
VYKKPKVEISEVIDVLHKHFSSEVREITLIEGKGNISTVFSFGLFDKEYVIKFSDSAGEFETEKFISNLLCSQGIPFPLCVELGRSKSFHYVISERISGQNLNSCSYEQQIRMLPEVIQILTRLNHVNLGTTKGYGMINSSGDGSHNSWKEHIVATYAEDQEDSFWQGWYGLFKTSCLEKEVFDECYNRLLAYSTYNEQHRYFIHGDFHQYNIMSNGQRITGVIDSNGKYGDFLIDLATLDWHIKTHLRQDVVQRYQDYQEKICIAIPNFKERLIGAQYYNGLAGLRFYAKMGWIDSYYELRDELLSLI